MTMVPQKTNSRSEIGPGEWIGEFEIIRRLRHGGMATIYLGRKHGMAGFSRNVAVKVIHPHLASNMQYLQMFADEARICSQISHPNVIHVEGFGQDENGFHYMAMEFIEGCSLSDVLKNLYQEQRQLEPELGAHIILQIAAGLHAAHESRGTDGQLLNIIHRDVSPANILLSVDGHVKVIDFGIAKSRGRLAETMDGQSLKGKFKYMAPEQAQADIELDRRADIFALGVVFWEILVGRPLFANTSVLAVLKRLTDPEITPPSEANSSVPQVLDAVVLGMLQQDREQRPETAWEVRRLIIEALPKAATRQAEELATLSQEVMTELGEHSDSTSQTPESPLCFSSVSSLNSPFSRPLTSAFGSVQSPQRPWWKKGAVQMLLAVILVSLVFYIFRRGGDSRAQQDVAKKETGAVNVAAQTTISNEHVGNDNRNGKAATPPPGKLSISTQENAQILLNGEVVGTTSLIDHELAPGHYLVEIQLTGYHGYRRAIVVEPAQSSVLEVQLDPLSRRSRGKHSRNNGQRSSSVTAKRNVKRSAVAASRPSVTNENAITKRETAGCATPYYFKDGKKIFKSACLDRDKSSSSSLSKGSRSGMAKSSTQKPDCTTPYFFKDGKKHFKLDCL